MNSCLDSKSHHNTIMLTWSSQKTTFLFVYKNEKYVTATSWSVVNILGQYYNWDAVTVCMLGKMVDNGECSLN